MSGGLQICNQSSSKWSHVAIRLNDKYLARENDIYAGACKYLLMSDFADPLKGVVHPNNEAPVKVEVLVGYNATGYASLKPE